MSAPAPRRSPLATVWTDRLWPVLAGVVAAVGIVAGCRLLGVPAVALILVGMWAFSTLVVFGAFMESGWSFTRAMRVTIEPSVAMVVALGLTGVLPVAGTVALAVVALTSPWSLAGLGWLACRFRLLTPAPAGPPVLDPTLVDRRFAEIIAALEDRSGGPEPR